MNNRAFAARGHCPQRGAVKHPHREDDERDERDEIRL
jgi:hypothetical protein